MENLIELGTYEDEQYGIIIQFLDEKNNCLFFKEEIDENNNKYLKKFDEVTNQVLENKYFSMESDIDE